MFGKIHIKSETRMEVVLSVIFNELFKMKLET